LRRDDGTWLTLDRSDGLVDDRVNHLAIQRRAGHEVLWVATPKGISRSDRSNWRGFPAGEDIARGHVNSLHVRGDMILAASSGGLSVGDGATWRKITPDQGLPLRQTTAVAIDAAGRIWAGGLSGLARLDGTKWRHLQAATGHLPDNWVTALAPRPDAGMWAGTYDAGLSELQPEPQPPRLVRESGRHGGLPCGWVNPNALLWHEGILWVGTMEGGLLARTKRGWHQLTSRQGLPGADVTAVAPAGPDRLWVATRSGAALLSIHRPARSPAHPARKEVKR
jgi:ligand-binding sensor domain-containing protein